MRLLSLSLETTARVCGQEISGKSNASRNNKPSYSEKCGQERSKSLLVLALRNLCTAIKRVRSNLVLTTVPESLYRETLRPCNKHGGTCTTHNSCDCRFFEKYGTEKSDFHAAKKGGKKSNPIKQSFAQLSKNSDWLEKVIKKKTPRSKNIAVAILILTPKRELDRGA